MWCPMSKPEDIPQEVWDIADGVRLAQRWLPYAMTNYSRATTEFISRAIMAAEKRGEEREREACADLVFSTPATIEHPAGPLYGAGWAAAVQLIRIAIRKRGEAAR